MVNQPQPIRAIADKLGIADELLEYYGKYTAKLRLELLTQSPAPPRGKLILLTAMTPTGHGEGKTVVSIGLAQAIERSGRRAIVTLREPSLGPLFGAKGGATGGGRSRLIPSETINLHFNGDIHAVTAAHNLLAAMIDSHIHHGNELRLDVDNIFWPRAIDMNDRVLRHIVVGLGGKLNGVPRETGFIITAASEIMAILALASSRQDLRRRLNDIVIGFDLAGNVVRAGDLKVTGALMVLLNEAIMPNLVQTSEHTPALVHTGPYANIAHGTSSVLAQKMALQLADYVVNETGFGVDLGAEKFIDIVMPASGLRPAAAVMIATVRALVEQGNGKLRDGLANLAKQAENLKKLRLPFVVALNRFASDTQPELNLVRDFCNELGAESSVVDVFDKGGAGGLDLAGKLMAIADAAKPELIEPLYPAKLTIEEKIETLAREIYGAAGVYVESAAHKKLKKFADLGFGRLPVCMAKTQASLTDDPKRRGAPKDWTLTVTDAHLSAGAGFIVVVAGHMLLMPGLPKIPQATKMDVTEDGTVVGLI